MSVACRVPGCYGSLEHGSGLNCRRHIDDPDAPPMKLTCECANPEWGWLPPFGSDCGFCRKCGSPIEGTLVP